MTSNMWATILLLVVLAMAAADRIIFDKTNSNRLEANRNCTTEYDDFFSPIKIECQLPGGTVSVKITKLGWVQISCEQYTALICDELQEFGNYLDGYVPPTIKATEESKEFLIHLFDIPANTTAVNGQLGSIEITNCDITRIDTACLPKLFALNGFSNVHLRGLRGQLQPIHLQTLMSATDLSIIDYVIDAKTDVLAIPYNLLSLLPKLKAYRMIGPHDMLLELNTEQTILRDLTYLELKLYKITALKKESFENTPNLITLKLERNMIEFIGDEAFEGLTQLETVDLVGNSITQLPGCLFRYSPNMREINIKYNKLKSEQMTQELSSDIQEPDEDAIFELVEPPSKKKHQNVAEPKSLVKLTTVEIFSNLTNLRKLSLHDNNIKIIPSKLFSHVNLTHLDLSINCIEYLPADIFNGQVLLEELDLNRIGLKSLPEGIFKNLGSLRMLNLGGNMLMTLDNSVFNGLKSLKRLYLYSNKIQNIDHLVFQAIPNLEFISLSYNGLTISREKNTRRSDDTRYESPLSALRNLREIDLRHNNVSVICDDWKEKKQLQKLILLVNSITSFTDHDWRNLRATNLTVDLRINHVQHIQSSKLYGPNITFLLDDNPYNCDCMLYDFIILHKTRRNSIGGVQLGDAKCSQPNNLKGTKFIDLNPDDLTCDVKCPTNAQITPGNCYNCIERPSKFRVEMICYKFPNIYPNLRKGFNSIHIKVDHASSVPPLPPQVRFIDLSNINLTEPPVTSGVELNLTYNNLTRAPIASLEGNCTIHLKNNPFICTCEGKNDIVILQKYKNQIPDYKLLTCSDNNFVSNVDTDQLCGARDGLIIGCSSVSVGLLLVIVIAFVYKYRKEIRILLRKYDLWYWKDKQSVLYDAYISYAPEDEAYVKTRMIPTLEKGRPPLHLCIPDRHWPIGGLIPELITESVEQSHRTIIVLSKNYLAYDWRRIELKMSYENEKMILLILDDLSGVKTDPEIRRYIRMSPVFKAYDRQVYEKLRRRIVKSQKIKKSRMIKLEEQGPN